MPSAPQLPSTPSVPLTPGVPPIPAGQLPSISGSAVQGATLTCSPGGWSNATSYTYTWLANAAAVAGPSASNTYTLTGADVGALITCSVTAYDGSTASLTPMTSLPIGPVSAPVPGAPVNEGPPVISGTAAEGQTVSCSSGAWLNAASYSYSWQRNAASIAGQTGSQYTLTAADVNQAITCMVIAHNSSGDSVPAVSAPIVAVAAPNAPVPVNVAPPSISGTAAVGQTVTCNPGAWIPDPTGYSYSWQRNSANVAGQTANQYTLTSGDLGQSVTCTVVAHSAVGNSFPAVSAPIVPAPAGSRSSSGSPGPGGGGGGRVGGSGGPKLHAPTITAFSVVPGKMLVSVRGKRQTTKGVTFRYQLDRNAGLLVVVQRRLAGRVKGKQCVAPTRRNRKAKSCTRYVTVATLVVSNAKAGVDKLKYAGRAGRQPLPTSGYRALAAAVNAAGWSKAKSANFAVVRKSAGRGRGKHRH